MCSSVTVVNRQQKIFSSPLPGDYSHLSHTFPLQTIISFALLGRLFFLTQKNEINQTRVKHHFSLLLTSKTSSKVVRKDRRDRQQQLKTWSERKHSSGALVTSSNCPFLFHTLARRSESSGEFESASGYAWRPPQTGSDWPFLAVCVGRFNRPNWTGVSGQVNRSNKKKRCDSQLQNKVSGCEATAVTLCVQSGRCWCQNETLFRADESLDCSPCSSTKVIIAHAFA
jgi:hypothetical protein